MKIWALEMEKKYARVGSIVLCGVLAKGFNIFWSNNKISITLFSQLYFFLDNQILVRNIWTHDPYYLNLYVSLQNYQTTLWPLFFQLHLIKKKEEKDTTGS